MWKEDLLMKLAMTCVLPGILLAIIAQARGAERLFAIGIISMFIGLCLVVLWVLHLVWSD